MRQLWSVFTGAVVALAMALPALAEVQSPPTPEPGTGWTLFPVPFVSTNPNEGIKYGLILALLQQEKGITKGIYAPSVSYSETLGLQGTFRYYGYPRRGLKYVVIASYGTQEDQEFYLYCDDVRLGQGRYEGEGTAFMNNVRAARYYGIGPETSEDDQWNYTLQDFGGSIKAGVMLADHLQVSVSPRIRKVNVLRGILPDLTEPKQPYPGGPGFDGSTTVGWGAQVKYDTRDNVDMPVEGIYARGTAELSARGLGSDVTFGRFGLDLRGFWSGQSRRYVTAVHGLMEVVVGPADAVPFFEQSQLGGARQLRGFPEGRWTDKAKVLATIEERARLFDLTLFDVFTQLELAAFLDLGKVFHEDQHFFPDFQPVVGGGIRFLVPPNVVATVDLGYGSEGIAVYATLGYPL